MCGTGGKEKLASMYPSKSKPTHLIAIFSSSIISRMIRESLSTVLEVNRSNFEKIISLDVPALIAYVDESDRKPGEVFTSISGSYQDHFIFGITSDVTLAKADLAQLPFIILYNPLDQVNAIFHDTFDIDKIEDFISTASTPLIGKFTLEAYYAYTKVCDLCVIYHLRLFDDEC
jgi:protein disulfide-isomerase A1